MDTISRADAKDRLSERVDQAQNGDAIDITRRGKAVARLSPLAEPRRQFDVAKLRALTSVMPQQEASAADLVRTMWDGDRC